MGCYGHFSAKTKILLYKINESAKNHETGQKHSNVCLSQAYTQLMIFRCLWIFFIQSCKGFQERGLYSPTYTSINHQIGHTGLFGLYINGNGAYMAQ